MWAGRTLILVGAMMAGAVLSTAAEAASERRPSSSSAQRRGADAPIAVATMPVVFRGPPVVAGAGTPLRPVSITSGLTCVPYVRMVTGMSVRGDGREWWYNAAATYARGRAPERGAVLAFPASGAMTGGHVAVVSRVVDDRTIMVDHANWGGPGIRRGTVMRNVRVVDVSDRNDWSAVRVQVAWDASILGRTYPTYGFIYNRRQDGTVMASAAMQEVAEAPSPHVAQHLRLAETQSR